MHLSTSVLGAAYIISLGQDGMKSWMALMDRNKLPGLTESLHNE